jgi:hypothetical protein
MPPEWLPSTINPKFVQGNQKKHATANDFEKFESPMKAEMKTYLIFQVITAFIFTMLAISPKSGMTGIEIVLVSLNLWLMAIHWSKIMESKKDAFTSELARLSIFSILIMSQFSHYQLQFLLMNLISFIFIFSSHFNLNARIRSKLAPLNRLR